MSDKSTTGFWDDFLPISLQLDCDLNRFTGKNRIIRFGFQLIEEQIRFKGKEIQRLTWIIEEFVDDSIAIHSQHSVGYVNATCAEL